MTGKHDWGWVPNAPWWTPEVKVAHDARLSSPALINSRLLQALATVQMASGQPEISSQTRDYLKRVEAVLFVLQVEVSGAVGRAGDTGVLVF